MSVPQLPNLYLRSDEERRYYQSVKTFAQKEIFPSVLERDTEETWSEEIWQKLSDMGLISVPVSEEFGGQGGDCRLSTIALEAITAGSMDGGLSLSVGAHMIIGTLPIYFMGTAEQKQKYLHDLTSGRKIAAFCLTEPDSGSDAANMRSWAEPVEGGFRLNGSKTYITNGPIADVFVVFARTKKSAGPVGVSAFILEKGMPGFTVAKVLKKLGHNTSKTAELAFDDVFVPAENLLGNPDSGFIAIGKSILEWERAVLVAGAVGSIEAGLEAALHYTTIREQFGRPIKQFPLMQEKLARMWVYLQANRRFVYLVATLKDMAHELPAEAAIGKLFASETGEEIASETVQIFGGMGYMKEAHVERAYRDSKLSTIGGGTSEIQRNIISSLFRSFDSFDEKMLAFTGISRTELHDIPGFAFTEQLRQVAESWRARRDLKREQMIQAAIADVIALYCHWSLAMADVRVENPDYPRADKIRDLRALMYFTTHRYSRSLAMLSPDLAGELMRETQIPAGIFTDIVMSIDPSGLVAV